MIGKTLGWCASVSAGGAQAYNSCPEPLTLQGSDRPLPLPALQSIGPTCIGSELYILWLPAPLQWHQDSLVEQCRT